jgi:hypothetical protein
MGKIPVFLIERRRKTPAWGQLQFALRTPRMSDCKSRLASGSAPLKRKYEPMEAISQLEKGRIVKGDISTWYTLKGFAPGNP